MQDALQAHVPTLLLMILVTSGAMAMAVLVVAWGRPARDGLSWWGWGMLLNTMAFASFGLPRSTESLWPLGLGNVLQSAALAAALHSIAIFRELAPARALLWAPVLAVAVLTGAFLDQSSWRVLSSDLVYTGQTAMAVWLAARPAQDMQSLPIERGRRLLAGGMALLTLVYLQRVAMILLGRDAGVVLLSPDWSQTLSYMLGLVGILFSTLGFVLMHKERAEAMYRRLALQDELTGIANRRAVMDALQQALAQASRAHQPVTVLMVDIDFFKRVNDVHGHPIGDLVLREVAQRMRRHVRAQDIVGRYGGEEFLAVLPNTEVAGALVLAENVRRNFELQPIFCQGREIAITVSIGVHGRVPHADPEAAYAMVDAADRALYAAKRNGRNQARVEA